MSTEPSNKATEFQENLTRERRRLRQLHQATRPRMQIEYRGHILHRENGDQSQSGCYRIINNGRFVDAIEPSDFYNADDFVRYVDLVIQHGRERAKDWLRNDLNWGWGEIPAKPTALPASDEDEDEVKESESETIEFEDDQFVVSKNALSSKKRHKPDVSEDGGFRPDCRTASHKPDSWTVKRECHTVFYDDCARCFGGGDE